MKKMYGFMILTGLILAMATAGGADSGVLSVSRLALQGAISSLLVLGGTQLGMRGDRA